MSVSVQTIEKKPSARAAIDAHKQETLRPASPTPPQTTAPAANHAQLSHKETLACAMATD